MAVRQAWHLGRADRAGIAALGANPIGVFGKRSPNFGSRFDLEPGQRPVDCVGGAFHVKRHVTDVGFSALVERNHDRAVWVFTF